MLKLFKNFKKKDYLLIFICLILIICQVWLDLKLPDYMSNITILIQKEGSQLSEIIKQGTYMLLCAFGSLIGAIVVGYLISFVSATFSLNIRKKIYEKVLSFSMEEVKKFSTSSLITRTTNDITHVQMFIAMGLQMIIKAPITAFWAILKILDKGWQWSALTAVAIAILITTISILIIFVLPKFKIIQKLIDNINNITREQLTGIRVVRAFNAEKFQENKFNAGNKKLTNTQLFTQRMMAIMAPVMYLTMNMLTLGIYFIGAILINQANAMDKINLFSNMIVFSSYAMQAIMAFIMLTIIFIIYPRASVSANRINEVLNTKSKIKNGKTDVNTNIKGKVEFRNVSFKYPDGEDYIIKDISFIANKGETVAFIGSTGSGKSTLVNLLLRFYDVTKGSILVDDIDIKDYKLEDLYNKLGYIPQKAVIFSDTIENNVAYGSNNKIVDEQIKKSIEIAQAEDFVLTEKEKYQTLIARDGTNISGGQKQRLAIARAIYKNPEIYIFDDSFSALDYKTDYLLRSKLKEYTKNATNIIVAQRIGTIKNANKILVLENGCCVGIGTHEKLLKECQVYKEIAYSQLSKEELENE